jgi:hypothetical protein
MSLSEAEVKRALQTRQEILEDFKKMSAAEKQDNESKMRAATRLWKVVDHQWFKVFPAPKKIGVFRTIDQWIRTELKESRSTVFNLIRIGKHLKGYDAGDLEKIGYSKVIELSRVARDRPKKAKEFEKLLRSKPDLTITDVKRIAANILADQHYDETNWVHFHFSLKDKEANVVRDALAVQQVLEPQDDPESPTAIGIHMRSICEEYLSGEEQKRVKSQIRRAGNTNFKVS